jgi:hypothetical protein
VQDFKKHFSKNYKMEIPFIGKRADVLNKKAAFAYFNNKHDLAEQLWAKAIHSSNQHYYSCFNLGMKRFLEGTITADALRSEFEDDVFEH